LPELFSTDLSALSSNHSSHVPSVPGSALAVTFSAWQNRSVTTNVQSPCHPQVPHDGSQKQDIQLIINGLVTGAQASAGHHSVASQCPADKKGRLIGKGIWLTAF
jgi:hypothetical protein